MPFRVYKENAVEPDSQTVGTAAEVLPIYERYFSNGYAVRVVETGSGVEYSLENGKLVPKPWGAQAGRT